MKSDLKRLRSFFCLFPTQWLPYIIVTAVAASRNFVISYISAMISSKAVAAVASRDLAVDSIINIVSRIVCFAAVDSAAIYFQTVIIHKISVILREKMFSRFLEASLLELDQFGGREELIARMNLDIDNAVGLLSGGLLLPVMYGISGIGATVIVFRQSRLICAVVYAAGLLVLFAQLCLSKLIRRYMTVIQKEKSAILSLSMQLFQNAAGIKLASLVHYVTGMYRTKIHRYDRTFFKKGVVDGACGAMQGALRLLCFFGVFCYGLFGAGMELEKVVLLSQIAPLIATMILSLSDCVAIVLKSMAGIDCILELHALVREEDGGDDFHVSQKEKGMEAKGVLCKYHDHAVRIADIDIGAEDENMIALKGPSGCGKTTLLRLLLKLYPYPKGTLRFCGQDINRCSCRSVRKSIAYVPQENVIFPGTIRENVLLGNHRHTVTDDEIRDVFEKIGADGWIEGTGLDFALKEGGANLSGGQRQMIAIARAVLYQKPVLILDEVFAAVDEEHIEKIMRWLSGMQKSMYVIIVTHDNRVIQRCSVVVDFRKER